MEIDKDLHGLIFSLGDTSTGKQTLKWLGVKGVAMCRDNTLISEYDTSLKLEFVFLQKHQFVFLQKHQCIPIFGVVLYIQQTFILTNEVPREITQKV